LSLYLLVGIPLFGFTVAKASETIVLAHMMSLDTRKNAFLRRGSVASVAAVSRASSSASEQHGHHLHHTATREDAADQEVGRGAAGALTELSTRRHAEERRSGSSMELTGV